MLQHISVEMSRFFFFVPLCSEGDIEGHWQDVASLNVLEIKDLLETAIESSSFVMEKVQHLDKIRRARSVVEHEERSVGDSVLAGAMKLKVTRC